jgi:hypothetical protein
MDVLDLERSTRQRAPKAALWLIPGALSLLLCSMGCADVSAPAVGGDGGSSGAGGSGGSGGAGGSGGTGLACDDGTVAEISSAECSACVACAIEGPCAADTEACNSSADCLSFIDCLNGCSGVGDPAACLDDCVNTTPSEGVDLYLAGQTCQFCEECPNNCKTGGPSCDGGSGGAGGTAGVCDDGTPDVSGSVNCDACLGCASTGPCRDRFDACSAAPGCAEYSDCVGSCWTTTDLDDLQACVDTCSVGATEESNLLDALGCAYCEECLTNCGAASICN